MAPVERRIATLEDEIARLRARMTQTGADGLSLPEVQSELLIAQANVETRQLMLATTLEQLETARIEANRQVRYLSLSVQPVAPDRPAYPRAFENTLVTLLIFAGIYLMISMTVAILREQVSG
jgi:capsular polysaccharide transport system permease protein